MRKVLSLCMAVCLLAGCSSASTTSSSDESVTYTIGICNYVDDASLNQIIANIKSELEVLEETYDAVFEVEEENANADAAVMNQIISNFIEDDVDLMVGVATPVAIAMQSSVEDKPIVFAAVSDPVSAGLVDSLETPGSNITGTSDYLDTDNIFNLIFAIDEDVDTIGLLYDLGQDSSTSSISAAKAFLDEKGISYKEYTGTNTSEISLAVSSMIEDGITVCFTPTDNTVMTAELSIYEELANAGIKHYTGADSFALNGAFLGYGVDYANLGKETADMIADILVNGKGVSTYSVKTFDNGIATINTEITETLGLDFEKVKELLAPYCTEVKGIETAESFE